MGKLRYYSLGTAFVCVAFVIDLKLIASNTTGDLLRAKVADLYSLRASFQQRNKLALNTTDLTPQSRPFGSAWSSLKSLIGPSAQLSNVQSSAVNHLLPNAQLLRKIAKISAEMDPGLKKSLVDRYNGMVSNFSAFTSQKFGLPAFLFNKLKLQNVPIDVQWTQVEQLLQSNTLEDLFRAVPSLTPAVKPVQSRTDEELVSDQEPDATVNGYKKKYSSTGIRLSTRHRIGSNKGDEDVSLASPDRTGYEYSSYADQYGLYGHDSYDTYGKGYEDYSKGYGGGGGHGHDSKGYESYSYHKGKFSSFKPTLTNFHNLKALQSESLARNN